MPDFLKTKAEFDALLAGKPGQLLVVYFTASWCPPCRMISPRIDKLAADVPAVVFVKVDVDENEATAQAQKVTSMPTFKLYKDGKLLETLVGGDCYDALVQQVKKHL